MDLGVEVEQRDFSQPDQRRLRPDLRFTLPTARPVFMRSDVAVTHPATRAVVEAQPSTADTPLLAATQTEKKKLRKYSALVQHEGSGLLPCVLESCGAWVKQADKLLKLMVRHAPFPR